MFLLQPHYFHSINLYEDPEDISKLESSPEIRKKKVMLLFMHSKFIVSVAK